ncbi:MAG: 5-(carboxyamino)imidazole ribonucleotide synthase [Pseudomonadota bacterium]
MTKIVVKTLGIIGGGQLGKMLALAAANLGIRSVIFTPESDCPASHVAYKTIIADYCDQEALAKFADEVDSITFEFENIPHQSLELLESKKAVCPNANILRISRNRLREKSFINDLGIGTANFAKVTSEQELQNAVSQIGLPAVLKTTEMGYDGKGQLTLRQESDIASAFASLKTEEAILEGFVDFVMEISVIVARDYDGKSLCYVPVQNIHKNHILDTTIAPAPISDELANHAEEIAIKIAQSLDLRGLLAVEMFVSKDGKILVNELAPRPHNSGHWTMDACITGQFEQLVRAVCGLPLGSPKRLCDAEMKNLIGDDINKCDEYLAISNAKLHLYGKAEARPGRKMGHVNFLLF